MGLADDIFREFLAANPDRAKGEWSEDELKEGLNTFMHMRNAQPIADFDGLSAAQMHVLLNNPFSQTSVLQRHETIAEAVLDQIPFFSLMETLYEILSMNPIKLTPKGNLPLSVCRELYERRYLVDEAIEKGYSARISEDNVAFIQALKACSLLSPHVKRRGNILSLTAKGEKSLTAGKDKRFWDLFETYTARFSWSYLDYHDARIGQFGWAYSLLLLQKYGAEFGDLTFYCSKVMLAFPHLKEEITSVRQPDFSVDPSRIYGLRFIERFAEWFGLIVYQEHPKYITGNPAHVIRKSVVLDGLFKSQI